MTAKKGGILVEGCVALSVLALMIPFFVDSVRRSQLQAMFHRGAFTLARLRALGADEAGVRRVRATLRTAFGARFSASLESRVGNSGVWGRVHLRYPILQPFRLNAIKRHHMEVTERCLFPY